MKASKSLALHKNRTRKRSSRTEMSTILIYIVIRQARATLHHNFLKSRAEVKQTKSKGHMNTVPCPKRLSPLVFFSCPTTEGNSWKRSFKNGPTNVAMASTWRHQHKNNMDNQKPLSSSVSTQRHTTRYLIRAMAVQPNHIVHEPCHNNETGTLDDNSRDQYGYFHQSMTSHTAVSSPALSSLSAANSLLSTVLRPAKSMKKARKQTRIPQLINQTVKRDGLPFQAQSGNMSKRFVSLQNQWKKWANKITNRIFELVDQTEKRDGLDFKGQSGNISKTLVSPKQYIDGNVQFTRLQHPRETEISLLVS